MCIFKYVHVSFNVGGGLDILEEPHNITNRTRGKRHAGGG